MSIEFVVSTLLFTLLAIVLAQADGFQSSKSEEPFLWGAATAAYQTEGETNTHGRGPSIWDTYSKIPGKIAGGDNGDIADDSYNKIIQDVQLLKSMNLNAYRFSLSWSRIIPLGYGEVNQEGIDHYNFLIDELLRKQIEPLVTLYHWDLPQGLEDKYEGWLSPNIEVDFTHFADICFKNFGDRVKKWATLNEPWTVCLHGYMTGAFAPGRCSSRDKCTHGDSSREGYIAAHNMLNAHAAVVALYRTRYQFIQRGLIGIVLNHDWAEPLTQSGADVAAAERRNEFAMGWFFDPLVFGSYPRSMRDLVGERLPRFTTIQQLLLVNSFDFIGLNHYSSKYFSNNSTYNGKGTGGWPDDQVTIESKYSASGELIGPQGESSWLNMVPWGFYNVIMWSFRRYGPHVRGGKGPLFYITENGCDVPGESQMEREDALQDSFRIDYYSQYLAQMHRCITEEGVDIVGYFAWSLLDNFEWVDGYSKRFGLFYVDYKDPNRARYAKNSAWWYRDYASKMADAYKGRSLKWQFPLLGFLYDAVSHTASLMHSKVIGAHLIDL